MRCPICDYDPELGQDQQSSYHNGLSFDVQPVFWLSTDGDVECNCFSEFDEDDVGLTEEDLDD
jgi:hypothetical protein